MKDHPSSQEFLRALANEEGPVFIILHTIAAPFKFHCPELGKSDVQHRDEFILFCNQVVGTWSKANDIFFLLNDQSNFLRLVRVPS
jgi:hypothetical protein